MTREQLEHAIRAACDVADDHELYVFGSQAILGSYPEAPQSFMCGWGPLPGDPLVTCSRGVNARTIAEWAIGAILHFYRDFHLYVEQSRARHWERQWSRELTGRALTVLGAGAAGSELAQLARAFGMRTRGVSRSGRPLPGFDEVLTPPHLDWSAADVTVVLLPLTDETRNLVDEARLATLRPGSLLLVASRGGIVDEAAVANAITSNHLAGAAFDVFAEEPLPPTSPLWNNPRILLTPHVAGTTDHFMLHTTRLLTDLWHAAPQSRKIGVPHDLE